MLKCDQINAQPFRISDLLNFRGKSGKWTEDDRNKVDLDSLVSEEPDIKRSRTDSGDLDPDPSNEGDVMC